MCEQQSLEFGQVCSVCEQQSLEFRQTCSVHEQQGVTFVSAPGAPSLKTPLIQGVYAAASQVNVGEVDWREGQTRATSGLHGSSVGSRFVGWFGSALVR